MARPVAKQLPFTTDGVADFHTVAEQSSPLRRGVAQSATGGGLSPESLAKGETRVTSNPHLQYRREAIATTIGATIESLFAHIGVSFTWTAPICIG